MYSLLSLGLVSFVVCFLMTPLVRNTFRKLGIFDNPGASRKIHVTPIPRVGGIAVALSYVITFSLLLLLPLGLGTEIKTNLSFVWRLAPAASLVFLTGLADDLFQLRPWQKLLGQCGAACLAWLEGVRILGINEGSTGEWWSFPVTLLWLIGCTNAFNLIDGVDGLASGVALFATMTTLVAALLHGNTPLALATVPLAGSLLAFLRYNFNPASIFLGDCGSLLLGFLLGSYGVMWSQKCSTLLGMTAPLMALSIPLLDTGLSIVRRLLRHQPIFGADRGHIHHRLLDSGLTPRRVALVIYGVCGLAAAFSLMQSVVNNEFRGLVIVLFCFSAWFGIQHLGYNEFRVARRMLFEGTFGSMVHAQLSLLNLEECLDHAGTLEECWEAIRAACGGFGFQDVTLRLAGRTFETRTGGAGGADRWVLHVPLSASDFIEVTRPFEAGNAPGFVAPFVDVVRGGVNSKLASFERVATMGSSKAAFSNANGNGNGNGNNRAIASL